MRVLADLRLGAARARDHVDPLDRRAGAREHGIRERAWRRGEREHRAMVVGIGMHVEQPRARRRR